MIRPPYLQKGDTVGIVACAGRISTGQLDFAIKTLETWGLKVLQGKYVYKPFHQFGATDEQRITDLQAMLDNPQVKAIVTARGGYGTVRIIDRLDFKAFVKTPKWVVGFSDITVLHSHIQQNFGIETLHSQMCLQFAEDKAATESIRQALFGEALNYQLAAGTYAALNRKGRAEGTLTGGNLTLLHALSASVSDVSTKDKILFIEDVGEQLYNLDRMMQFMKRANKLSGLKGMFVGQFAGMLDGAVPFGKNAMEIVYDAVKDYQYPVYFGFPVGHVAHNVALLLGRSATLEVTDKGMTLGFANALAT